MTNETAAILEGNRWDMTAPALQELRQIAIAGLELCALLRLDDTLSETARLNAELFGRIHLARVQLELLARADADTHGQGPLRLLDHFADQALNRPLTQPPKGRQTDGT